VFRACNSPTSSIPQQPDSPRALKVPKSPLALGECLRDFIQRSHSPGEKRGRQRVVLEPQWMDPWQKQTQKGSTRKPKCKRRPTPSPRPRNLRGEKGSTACRLLLGLPSCSSSVPPPSMLQSLVMSIDSSPVNGGPRIEDEIGNLRRSFFEPQAPNSTK